MRLDFYEQKRSENLSRIIPFRGLMRMTNGLKLIPFRGLMRRTNR